MFLHDYLLACEISTVRTQTLNKFIFIQTAVNSIPEYHKAIKIHIFSF